MTHSRTIRLAMLLAVVLPVTLGSPQPARAEQTLEQLQKREDEILQRMDALSLIDDPSPDELAEMQRLSDEYDVLRKKLEAAEKDKKASGVKSSPKPRAKPSPKPAAKPGAKTPTPRRTPKPVKLPGSGKGQAGAKPAATPGPRRSPAQRSKAKRDRKAKVPRKPGAAAKPEHEVKLNTELNELAENLLKNYRDRQYEFAIENGTYAELIEAFARMSGLEVIGAAPDGTVSFTSRAKMDFKSALGRIQMLLFEHPQQYWILLRDAESDPYLEITRVTEVQRILDNSQIFATVKEYRDRHLDENDLALLQFTPQTGSIAEIQFLRDFMPDYVRISQKEGENALLIFGLVRDINKYLSLVEKFRVTIEDPRQIVVIPVEHVAPSAALELLKQLMDGFGNVTGAPARVRRPGQVSVAEAWAQKVTALPFDDQGTLLVKAMPNKITEIKRLLPYIDIAPESGKPVVVSVKNGNPSDIITIVRSVMTTGKPGAAPPPRRATSRNKKAPADTARVYAAKELTMIDWAASHAIILMGPADDVAEAKELIARFDVPDDKDIVQVALKHRDGNELAQHVTQIAQVMRPGSAARLSCTASPTGDSVILAGPLLEIEAAKVIIARLDVEPLGPAETVHVYPLKHVLPSQMVSVLTAWEASAAGAATTGSVVKRRARRAAAGSGKFHPDDQHGVLYVVCTDKEWTDRFEPVLAQLDQEFESPDVELLPVKHLDPQEAVARITSLFTGAVKANRPGQGAVPKCIAVPEGVMVLDATAAQMSAIRSLLEQIDVDLLATGRRVKRIFELKHADPVEVIDRLNALTGSPPPARKGGTAPPEAKALFMDHQDTIIAWAPARLMDEIAELVEQLDTPPNESVLRSYVFDAGVDVVALSDMLTRFFAGSGGAPRAQPGQRRPGRKGQPVRAATGGGAGSILFMPQPVSRRIVVSAPADRFEKIEQTIEMLRPDGPNADAAVVVRFFDVTHGDAETIARMIEPIVQLKLDQMVASREVMIAAEGKAPKVKVAADAGSSRIVAAVPAILVPDVEQLVKRFDGGDYGKRTTRRVQLAHAKAEDVVEMVKVMLSAASGMKPGSRMPVNRKGPAGKTAGPVSARGEKVSVVPALSDNAVILVGFEKRLDEVEGWIRELDESTPDEYEIKVFSDLDVDVETLADEILTILDKPAAAGGKKKADEEDLFGDSGLWDFGGPRCGAKICLTTNPFSNVLVVRTTPDLMRDVEKWVDLYKTQKITSVAADSRPKLILELTNADAYDAVYDLENLIDVIWTTNKPTVEKVPFENMLMIRAKTEKDLDEVKAYVAKYIDKPSKAGRVFRTTAVKGKPADVVLKMLMTRLEGMDVEIEGLTNEKGKPLLPILEPHRCVLPAQLVTQAAALSESAALLLAQAESPHEQPESDSSGTSAANQRLEDLLEKKSQPESPTATAAGPDKDAGASPEATPLPKPTIKIDPQTNSLVVSGSAQQVAEIEDLIDDILRELEVVEGIPDIRVYQLEYLDPNIAAQVLGAMFNVANRPTQGRLNPQQLAAQRKQMQQQMQQQLKQMQQMQQMQQGQQTPKGGAQKEGEKKGREGRGKEEGAGESSRAQSSSPPIRVFPYPALRALIVNAPTEMYPAIEKLVATIDRKREVPPEYRFFPLVRQRASDVEQMLKIMLGLDQKATATGRRGGRNTDPAVQAVAELMKAQLNLPVTGPQGEIVSSSESITITSNDNTNTVMAVAPVSVLDLIDQIIKDLEAQEIPPIETRSFVLKFADAAVVAPMLEQLFPVRPTNKGAGKGGTAGSAYNPSEVSQYVSFHADEANNAVFVRGIASDFEKIEPVIAQVDIKTAGDSVVSFELIHADARDVAQSLTQVYERRTGRGGQGKGRIDFVGDKSSNTLFARVPEELREEIAQKVSLMDRLAASTPRLITLEFGNARDIAETLERVYGGGRGGSSRVKISGDATTKQLLVVCPDEQFEQIKKTASMMDVKENLDIQVFKLKHAKAPDVLESMQQLVRDAMRTMSRTGGGSQMGPFSATADARTNSIAVMGGPVAFAMVSKVLADIDVPADKAGGKSVRVVNLKYADPAGVVQSLRELLVWGKPRGGGVDVSNPRGTNTVVVNATAQDFEEIKKVIEQLDVLPGDEQRSARLITLKHTDAAEMQSIVEDYLAKPAGRGGRGGRQDLVGGIRVSALESSNTLVVTGDGPGIERVASLLAKIDVPVDSGLAPKIITLTNAVASEVEPTLTAMFEEGGNRRAGRGRRRGGSSGGGKAPIIVADDGSNALIVRASPSDYTLIESLARELDEGQARAGTPFKLIPLASAFRAEDLAPLVESTLRQATAPRSASRSGRGGRGGRGSESQLTVEAIAASNSLLIAGDPKDLELAAAVVSTIQAQGPAGGKGTIILRPENISPDELKRVIDSMLDKNTSQGSRSGARRPRRR